MRHRPHSRGFEPTAMGPSIAFELDARKSAEIIHVAGLDEAGRGALAGPVVAAAVILPLDDVKRLAQFDGINDSKQLTSKRRANFFDIITANALAYGIGSGSAQLIDGDGIIGATKHAMREALGRCKVSAEFLLIDGRIRLKTIALPQKSIIRGDSHSLSIAAASILAKVTRDRLMIALDAQYPEYGFARHKGYGTQFHRDQIAAIGPCAVHRHSFAPIRPKITILD